MSEILDFTPDKRLLKASKVDKIIYQIIVFLSYYFALFGKLFGVSRLAILSITAITIFGLKYGYTLDNIRALIAQSRLETGDFTSRMAKEDNNLFGMHFPFSRSTYSTHARWNATEVADIAIFPTYLESVLDRFQWEQQFGRHPNMIPKHFQQNHFYRFGITMGYCSYLIAQNGEPLRGVLKPTLTRYLKQLG